MKVIEFILECLKNWLNQECPFILFHIPKHFLTHLYFNNYPNDGAKYNRGYCIVLKFEHHIFGPLPNTHFVRYSKTQHWTDTEQNRHSIQTEQAERSEWFTSMVQLNDDS